MLLEYWPQAQQYAHTAITEGVPAVVRSYSLGLQA
jgi:hypothetical protein